MSRCAEAIVRVSDLSDDILYHVLSSLRDAKLVVQTSVLSKRWRYLWKDVGILNLHERGLQNFPTQLSSPSIETRNRRHGY
ncbi:unnamed protein product [Linum tenue]|uniref:F-box domain-containing protein n=1 Tax=Linum tenue TaxID=586396 RepID=A0AAV0GR16_9ROSI|nr:unnamed protein product [Linum tenue]